VSKLLVGPAGAVIGGVLAAVIFPYGRARMRLFDAAFFAFLALALLHLVWAIAHSRRKEHEPNLEQDAPGNKITAPPATPGAISAGH
jgi:nitrate/nitrite transporter NarK